MGSRTIIEEKLRLVIKNAKKIERTKYFFLTFLKDDNNLGPGHLAGAKALDPNYYSQTTL